MESPKKLAALIVAKKPPDEAVEGDDESEAPDIGLNAAASDVMAALKDNNPESFKLALRDFVAMCKEDY